MSAETGKKPTVREPINIPDDRPDWMRRCPPEEPLTDEECGIIGWIFFVGLVILLGVGFIAALALGWVQNPPWPIRVVNAMLISLAEWLR